MLKQLCHLFSLFKQKCPKPSAHSFSNVRNFLLLHVLCDKKWNILQGLQNYWRTSPCAPRYSKGIFTHYWLLKIKIFLVLCKLNRLIHQNLHLSRQVWLTARCSTRWSVATECPAQQSAPAPYTSSCFPVGGRIQKRDLRLSTCRAS